MIMLMLMIVIYLKSSTFTRLHSTSSTGLPGVLLVDADALLLAVQRDGHQGLAHERHEAADPEAEQLRAQVLP